MQLSPANRSLYVAGSSVEPSPRWVHVKFGDETVADSKHAQLLIQYAPGQLPTYYFPPSDVRLDLLEPAIAPAAQDEAQSWTVKVGERMAAQSAWSLLDPPTHLAPLKGHFTFAWKAMDGWYEEDEEIFVHARDPYKRVDALASSRHIRVVIAGATVAETQRAHLLFETGLPTRYYIPPEDVRMTLLQPTDLATRCPYKGVAAYWSVTVGDQVAQNVVWSYPNPIPECPKIKGLLCFFNERVEIYVDGELQTTPQTEWS